MTPIRGQGHGGSKVAKMADFEVYPVRQYAKKNQQTNGEFRYKTISKFNRTDFRYSSS